MLSQTDRPAQTPETSDTDTTSSANEITPLRRSQDAIAGDTPSLVTIRSSKRSHKMDNNKRILFKLAIDFFLLCCVSIPILIFFLIGDPYKRGFFCDDESLMHPFHDSTVRNYYLYIMGLALPLLIIVLTECLRAKQKLDDTREVTIFNWTVPVWLQNCYKYVGIFGFGAACSQLSTDIGKYSIGRLRPHFFDVCQPIMQDGTNCSNPINARRYIETFTCQGVGSSARMLKEMRLSFPSGHASFSAYTMIFCALFLHSRMSWKGSKLTKHVLQFLLIIMAWFTALSRISDYKHHWSDVLAGSILGVTVALLIVNFVSDLFKPKRLPEKFLPTRYEVNSPGHVITNGNNN